jgi:ribonuclease E
MAHGASEISMSKRMLIDSSHPEETRVVVLDGQKVEEFDFEAASKRPLKGNIYLAKVTRVEPSLQAAFVEYGGNRQGFLAFSEIHPDYYQIPVADRMALIAEAEAEARRRQEDDVESFEISSGPKPPISDDDEDEELSAESGEDAARETEDGAEATAETTPEGTPVEGEPSDANEEDDEDEEEDVFVHRGAHADSPESAHGPAESAAIPGDEIPFIPRDETEPTDADAADLAEEEDEDGIADEQTAASAAIERGASEHGEIQSPDHAITDNIADIQTASEEPTTDEHGHAKPLQSSRPPQRWMRKRHYKIQEVIKRRQIILVQVVKEERGNKGAALTTYLSLAGRYCVLMPNTPRGGGISRKITNAADRKRLKSAAQGLELPEGMGLIIRTAGENRTKVEIRRDYEYLLRMWDTIRELTLKSNAPACVYEEGDLIKRAIRDLYNKDVIDVVVEGDDGYRNAKDFMRMLMPSHAKNVKPYKEPVPLFQRHHIEAQLDAMFSPTVTLKSGGYIVINQTEALVSIDVNSGRATREHSIEETAHKTNLEAADEIGRQLRLRDLAGLIVIDFIDMEEGRNDRDVEKRIRDAVKNDRARVQIGKISQFGLLEMSRQRLRAGVIAGSTVPCPHCGGQGIVRSVESTALRVLRSLEEEGQRLKASAVTVRVVGEVAIYTLNQKRKELARIEHDYGMEIEFEPKEGLPAGTFDLERTAQKTPEERARYAGAVEAGSTTPVQFEADAEDAAFEETIEEEIEEEEDIEDREILAQPETHEQRQPEGHEHRPPQGENGGGRRKRRRRGGRGRGGDRGERNWSGGREQGSQPQAQLAAPDQHAPVVTESGADSDGIPAPSVQAQQHQHRDQPGQPGTGGRRRRRRRGRRGQSNGQASGQQSAPRDFAEAPKPENGNWNEHFGADGEIDTTPREDRTPPVIQPNASSAPEWSLGHSAPPKPEPVTPAPMASEPKPAEPAKRGWWQRAFKSD